MMKFVALAGTLAATLLIAGCASDKSATTADLAGTWQLTMPSGFQHKVRITREGEQLFHLSKAGTIINGTYERRGNRLYMIRPADSVLTDWVWKIDNGNELTLVKEPDVTKTGGHYRASKLTRMGAGSRPTLTLPNGTQIEVTP